MLYPTTRNLMPYFVLRNSRTSVWLNFIEKTPAGNGSYTTTYRPEQTLAMVIDLTQADIQRLQSEGITLNSGTSVSVPYQVSSIPDSVTYNGMQYKIEHYVVSEGVSIFILPKKPIGNAVIEAGA